MSEKLSYEELRRRVRELEEILERFSRQEESHRNKLNQLSHIGRIDEALRCSSDMDIVLWEVLGLVLDIFRCDRAWLLHPCDPEAPAWEVRMERTNPEYPGLKGEAAEMPMTPEVADFLRTALQARGTVIHGPQGYPLTETAKSWRIQSQLSAAFRPEKDRPWLLGVHQCSYPRTWSTEEKDLLRETGYRIALTMNQFAPSLRGDHKDRPFDRESDLLLEAQVRLGEQLAVVTDLSDGLDRCVESALAVSGMESGGVYLFQDSGEAVLANNFNLSPRFIEQVGKTSLDTPMGRRIKEGRPLFLRTADQQSPLRGFLEGEKILNVAVLPLRYEGETVGCMNIASRVVPEINAETRQALLSVSQLAGSAIGRIRANDALREGEARYRTIVTTLPLGVAEIDIEGNIVFSNAAHDAIYGYQPGEMTGMNVTDLLRSEQDGGRLRAYLSMLADKESPPAPWAGVGRRRDGSPVEIRVDWNYRRNATGKVKGFSAVVTDVTKQRQAQRALQDSEEKFRRFAEESPNMILIESESKVVYANRQCELLLGMGSMEFYSGAVQFEDLVLPEGREEAAAARRRLLEGGDGEEFDCRLAGAAKGTLDVIVASRLISYRGDMAILRIITDITERRQAEKALRESEERYRGLVEESHEIIFTLDRQGRFVQLNLAFEDATGWSVGDWMGRHFNEIVHPDDHVHLAERFAALSIGEKLPQNEVRIHSKEGELITIAYSSVPIMKDNVMDGVWGIARDVTMRRKAEEDRQNLAALREREGVSRWLHDHLGADLYNVVLLADSIQRRGNVDPVAEQQLEWITETSRNALSSIRNYLDFAGSAGGAFIELVKSIEQYGATVLKPLGIIYSFERRGDLAAIKLSGIQAFNIYLIFKEALTNVVKHARASRVSVMAALEEGVLSIIVEDNGTGIALGESSHGHGRMNIRARAEELGAGLAITSSQEGGTRVSLSLTVPR